ncbi:MAG TPA: TIGR01777 family oxidoreductase [Paludibacter sp.]|nr:TIGR01777 family oxidoreductase [Paludibacter sp.]
MKKVVIAGGTGFIGSYLTSRFNKNGYDTFIVSRQPGHVSWNEAELTDALEEAELVINLAGKSINSIHSGSNKKELVSSRLNSTRKIGNAISACKTPPKLWINASAAGIYKPSSTHGMTEKKHETDDSFLARLVSEWENTFFDFRLPATRQVALRTSVVLGKDGGALKPMSKLASLGLGGPQAGGQQVFSWIHIEDYFRIILFLLENPELKGIFNCTAPTPVSNKEFMFTLRDAKKVGIGIPAPEFAIRLGAKLLGTEPDLILKSSYLIPENLLSAGYQFNFPTLESALTDIFKTKNKLPKTRKFLA